MEKNMSRDEIISIVREAAEPVAASLGLSLWGIDVTPGPRTMVRVFVDGAVGNADGDGAANAQGGVTVDQCAEISRLVGLALDVEDIVPGAWVLEVSSPGFERIFFSPGQMLPYVGRDVDVTLLDPHPGISGRRKFRGPLRSVDGDIFTVEVLLAPQAGQDLRPVSVPIDWKMVKKAHLVHIFPEVSKPGGGKRPKDGARNGGRQG